MDTENSTQITTGFGRSQPIALWCLNNQGALVAVGNDPTALAASLTTTLVAGDYTVEVDGVGVGNPTNNPTITGEEPGDPTMAVLSSMSATEVSAGKGRSHGQVTVAVENELGQPVSGAIVNIEFTGAFSDDVSMTTDTAGRATYTTSTSAQKPSFEVCVTNVVAGSLTYAGGTVCRIG